MKIVVCIRQGLDGEISPFDACAYESALQIQGAEVTLLSMGPLSVKDLLLKLTRLGAKRAILLSDQAFSGADTLATAYTLSLAVKKLQPDLVLCGRQTLVGDTAQTGPMLSVMADLSLITNVLKIENLSTQVTCTKRDGNVQTAALPALLTVERINTLRLPSILSKPGSVEFWSSEDLDADLQQCGLLGSPTRVLQTFENQSGKRKCRFISPDQLEEAIQIGLQKEKERIALPHTQSVNLKKVCIIGEDPRAFAESVSDDITILPLTDATDLAEQITDLRPSAVLWGSDDYSKQVAAQVSALLRLGLCADCTALETDGERLLMYRPALSGSVIAKIESLTRPAMATVRTTQQGGDIVVTAGYGAKDCIDDLSAFADRIGATLGASRKVVDNSILPYPLQVGLTGRTVSPPVYIAVGVSGAVHHLVGIRASGTVIAVNPDKDAPIFDYADFGILAKAEEVF